MDKLNFGYEIEVVLQRGTTIFIYGNNGDVLCTTTGDKIIGYTCKTFTIKKGKVVRVFAYTGRL